MRRGQNPAKDHLPAYQPPRLGIALLSYIPAQAGYFEHSMEILKYQIASLHHSTGVDFDLVVFDNGSCREVQAELQRLNAAGWIDFLISARHNLGKTGALNWILGAMPNEIICYSDSDVLFRPGWAENSLKIVESFSRAGIVSAQPCLDDVLRGSGKAHLSLESDDHFLVESRLLDPQAIEEYALGVTLPPERTSHLKKRAVQVAVCQASGVQAVIGATHMQFMIPRVVARQMIPLQVTYGLGRAEDRAFDQKVDQAGYLHLSTLQAYVWHMGNRPDAKTMGEVESMGLLQILLKPEKRKSPGKRNKVMRLFRWLARRRLLRSALYRVYNFLFELYAS